MDVSFRRAFRKAARSTSSVFIPRKAENTFAYTILCVVTVVTNARLGQAAGASQWPAQNIVIAPMTIATGVAAIFINSRLAANFGARDSNRGLYLVLCRTTDGVIGMMFGAKETYAMANQVHPFGCVLARLAR